MTGTQIPGLQFQVLDCCALHAAASAVRADGIELGVRLDPAGFEVTAFKGGGLFRRLGLVDEAELLALLDGAPIPGG